MAIITSLQVINIVHFFIYSERASLAHCTNSLQNSASACAHLSDLGLVAQRNCTNSIIAIRF